MTIDRRLIRNAPYNPRVLDKHARKKLRDSLSSVGLVETPVWNVRTGNLVGGHQRLSILDDLEGTQAYTLTVAQVDLSEKAEKQLNVFLNNPSVAGSWDLEALAAIVREDGIELDKLGFDRMELQLMYDDADMAPLFDDAKDKAAPEVAALAAMREQSKAAQAPASLPGPDSSTPQTDTSAVDLKAAEIQGMKDRKAAYRAKARAEDDAGFYIVVVFQSRDENNRFMKLLGLPADDQYIDGRKLASLVNLDLSPPPPPEPEVGAKKSPDASEGAGAEASEVVAAVATGTLTPFKPTLRPQTGSHA